LDLEIKWRLAASMARPGIAASNQAIDRIIELQKTRLRFDELGAQLEAYDRVLPSQTSPRHDIEAAEEYRASGNTVAELRVLKRLSDRHQATGPLLERYTQLLIAQPPRLTAAIAAESDAPTVNTMLNYVLQHASAAVSQQAIAARGQKTSPLWTKAYTGLTGLYFASSAAPVKSAFITILGPMTVGARIAKPADRDQQLAGDVWFYYGSRYGEYLVATKQAGSEDYLPAMVEATPGRSEAYFTLAEYSSDAADYQNALELNPGRADVHDRLAVIASKQGRSADALREWKLAFVAFSQMMDRSRVPQKFWTDLSDTLRHIGEAKQLPALRDDIDKLLRTYIRRNGAFEIQGILEAALIASGDATAGTTWIADLSRAAADPVQFLSAIVDRSWIPEAQKNILYQQIVESAEARVAQTFGEQQSNAETQLWTWEMSWVEFLLTRHENDRAGQVLATIPAGARAFRGSDLITLEIRVAARTNALAAQLAKYPGPAPVAYLWDALRNAANVLAEDGDVASSRRVLEFVYTNQMKAGNLDQATFLGLAEIKSTGDQDLAAAMALLRRMVLISGEPFTGLDPAAALLERTHHPAEAAEFLATLIKAEPWNQDAKRRLAEAQSAAPKTPNPWDTLPTDAAAREKALLAIIAADPRVSTPKRLLIHAAIETRHYALAVAVARQVLPQFFREDSEYTEWVARSFLPNLDSVERASLARGLADAQQRLGDLRAAFLYEQIAQFIAPSDAARRSVNALRSRIHVEMQNDGRRPMVNDALDQDRLVRPKVGMQ
jgi:tetratricopeptide (TPR) repeat protein